MKNKLSKGLSLSANPEHLIKGTFSAVQHVFAGFGRKIDTFGNNTVRTKLAGGNRSAFPAPVILGLVPRIFWQQGSNLVNKLALLLNKCWSSVFSAFRMFFKYPSPEAYASPSPARGEGLHRPWCHKILGTGPSMTGARDANPLGRSMIEMLGVLAIIGVLSVGGIAGYSKAMEKFKLNKVINEYSMFLYNMVEHLDDLHRWAHETTQQSQVITEELYAMNIVPDVWSQESTKYFKDSMGNSVAVSVAPYMGAALPDRLSVSIYLGGLTSTNSAGFTVNLCTSFFTDILIPLQSTLIDAKLYRHKASFSQEWAGSAYCTANRQCLSNMTLSDVHELCSSCDSKNDICQINFNI